MKNDSTDHVIVLALLCCCDLGWVGGGNSRRLSECSAVAHNASTAAESGVAQCSHSYTHTHTHLTALCPGLPRGNRYQKGKTSLDFTEARKQETVSGSGISWAVCKSAPRSRQITMPAPPPLSFLQAGCPSCRPTNSVKALKAQCSHSCCLHNFILFILLLVQPVFLVVVFVMSQPFDSSVV